MGRAATRNRQAGRGARVLQDAHDTKAALLRRAIAWTGIIAVCVIWSYWTTIVELVQFWGRNQDYSVGMLVPFVVAWLVWRKRDYLLKLSHRPSLWGAGLILIAEGIRAAGVFFGVGSAERYALVLVIAGATMLAAGRRVAWTLRWMWLFMILMVPLPARIHEVIAVPLQSLATKSAVFGLELLGFFVVREGNLLRLGNGQAVAVAEACSGLRMLTAFVFVSAVLAFLVDRPRWQKWLLVAFSVPIAVLSNSLRVLATSLFVHYSGSGTLTETFHDLAGLAMMPLAILCCLGLLKFFRLLESADGASGSGGASSGGRPPKTSNVQGLNAKHPKPVMGGRP